MKKSLRNKLIQRCLEADKSLNPYVLEEVVRVSKEGLSVDEIIKEVKFLEEELTKILSPVVEEHPKPDPDFQKKYPGRHSM